MKKVEKVNWRFEEESWVTGKREEKIGWEDDSVNYITTCWARTKA